METMCTPLAPREVVQDLNLVRNIGFAGRPRVLILAFDL